MLIIYAIMVSYFFLVITGLPVCPFHSLPVFPSALAELNDFKEEIPAIFLKYELPPRISSETDEELVILQLLFFYKFIYLFILLFYFIFRSCLSIRVS